MFVGSTFLPSVRSSVQITSHSYTGVEYFHCQRSRLFLSLPSRLCSPLQSQTSTRDCIHLFHQNSMFSTSRFSKVPSVQSIEILRSILFIICMSCRCNCIFSLCLHFVANSLSSLRKVSFEQCSPLFHFPRLHPLIDTRYPFQYLKLCTLLSTSLCICQLPGQHHPGLFEVFLHE